ncbi:PilX N-terminal domain-containing pilus assembly protein [Variovorax sp. E3]|jgi:type IV pilus assembly protein PilX|uniref:pilus assembly PilX family protein n=1 Tax=Variovorax sp. E3 TaxID=1914993 RepID=UPI0018DE81C3|nr:pilus assembly protein [Variovorax sp. E3]
MSTHAHTPLSAARSGSRSTEQGFVLIVAMLFLIVLTVLSVSMFRSFNLQERIAGNTREKERALEAAQSALQYGEWWLGQGNGSTGANCSGVLNANTLSQMQVCSNMLTAPTTLPWSARADYLPPNMTVATGGGIAASGDINYNAKPGLSIGYLGLSPDGKSLLYQVSAFGYGGSTTAAAVVQSTYQVSGGNKPLDQP